jgi:hypothetical protein
MSVIVTARAPRRKPPAKAALPIEIKAPRVVQTTRKGRARTVKKLAPDPEADARVAAFFARVIRPR